MAFVMFVVFILNDVDKKQDQEITYVDKNTSIQEYIHDEIVYEEDEAGGAEDLIVLYKGDEVNLKPGIQFFYNNYLAMKYMSKDRGITYYKVGSQKAEEAKQEMIRRFERTFFNFEKGKYIGASKGRITTDDEENENPFPLGHGLTCIVMNVSHEFAFSKKFDPFPRKSTKVSDYSNFVEDGKSYTKIEVDKIDLDNDGKDEFIVLLLNSEGLNASSEILLYDSDYEKIDTLVTLSEGYWVGDEKTETNKVFLSLEDVTYIDLDDDGKMEIFISLPGYEWEVVDILKYSEGKVQGTTNYEVSLST